MKINAIGLLFGVAFGFVMAWARLADPVVIRDMLLLRELDVFLLMGSAMFVAAVGVRLLRTKGARAIATGEAIGWTVDKPERKHVLGSLLFGVGWSLACTCPGPVAVMVGEGRLGGVFVVLGLLLGVGLQGAVVRKRTASPGVAETAGAGL